MLTTEEQQRLFFQDVTLSFGEPQRLAALRLPLGDAWSCDRTARLANLRMSKWSRSCAGAGQRPMPEVAKKHGVISQTI